MDILAVGLLGVTSAGYIIWRFYRSVRAGNDCSSGGCAGCARDCGCASTLEKK